MFYSKAKTEAIAKHEKALESYNTAVGEVQKKCERLYAKRQQSIAKINEIETLINSIANTPKDFNASFERINIERTKFRETETFVTEAYNAAVKSGVGAGVGVGAGAAVAGLAPTAAMWVATTFGTASTGTAISALSGAAATKAALAWLGGGALVKGGAGIAGGKALLALAGPIGWGIAATATTVSVFFLSKKNKNIAEEANAETLKLTEARAEMEKAVSIINSIRQETGRLFNKITSQLADTMPLKGGNYSDMSEDEQLLLGTLVNNTLSLAEMLNKTVEERL